MIEQPYTLAEIREKIASHDYNAELMLLHLLLRVAELEGGLTVAHARIKVLEMQAPGYAELERERIIALLLSLDCPYALCLPTSEDGDWEPVMEPEIRAALTTKQ